MIKVSDAMGNCFFTDSEPLAEKVVKENDNPFIKCSRTDEKVAKEHIVKTYADFCVYFY